MIVKISSEDKPDIYFNVHSKEEVTNLYKVGFEEQPVVNVVELTPEQFAAEMPKEFKIDEDTSF